MQEGRECVFMFVPDGQDPDSWVQPVGTETFRTAINDAASLTQILLAARSKTVNLGSLERRARLIEMARPHDDQLPPDALRTPRIDELSSSAWLGRDDSGGMLGRSRGNATGR